MLYAREDRSCVGRLVRLIERRHTVWWDQHIDSGRWDKQVNEALVTAKAAVVIWSRRSIDKDIVRAEARRAIKKNKPLLMLRIDEVDLPLNVAEHLCIDAFGWRGDEGDENIQSLVEKIDRTLDPRPSVPSTGRLPNAEIAGKQLALPSFFRSISSFETQLVPSACVRLLDLHDTKEMLISAYDMGAIPKAQRGATFAVIERMRKRGALVVMDSGNYEAFRKSDFKSASNKTGWSHARYRRVMSAVPFDIAFTFDDFKDKPTADLAVKAVVEAFERDQSIVTGRVVCPIVHAPTKAGLRQSTELPYVISAVCRAVRPQLVAVPERELGDGLIARARCVMEIRRLLNELPWYQPLHLLGTGNPWSIAVFAASGADVFDGLEWCRTCANDETGALYHFQQFDLFKYQARLARSAATRLAVDNQDFPFPAQVALHNLEVYNNWMERLRESVPAGTTGSFLARRLGRQFDDLKAGLPEVLR